MKKLLTRILWFRRSKWQFLLAGFGFLMGACLLLFAFQVYIDFSGLLAERKKEKQFLVINKNISLSHTLGLASSEFKPDEIDSLKALKSVEAVGEFEANQFQAVVRTTKFIDFSTLFFFESVPSTFLDQKPDRWYWSPQMDEVPVILSQDFLNLYNFGFALSQGLPQISKDAIKIVPLDLKISGPGGTRSFTAKIAGFSNRISSVLVPQEFMRYANDSIGRKKQDAPSRLILKVNNPGDPVLKALMTKRNYQTSEEKMLSGQAGLLLTMALTVVGFLGALFLMLSVVVFVLNFKVIIAEAQEEINLLVQIGYRHGEIALNLLVYFWAFLCLVGAIMLLVAARGLKYFHNWLASQGFDFDHGLQWPVAVLGLLVVALVGLLNTLLIRRQLNRAK